MKNLLFFSILLLCSFRVLGQAEPDTFQYSLPDFIVEAQKDSNYQKKYQRLVYNVKKVLPYAKMASFRFQLMEQNLQVLPSDKARKEYLRRTKRL